MRFSRYQRPPEGSDTHGIGHPALPVESC
jgi:hypothetical protein